MKNTDNDVSTLITELRKLAPKQALSYGQSLQLARVQAAHVRRWANADQPDINLLWLHEQTAVPVVHDASKILHEESGMTTNAPDGVLRMYLNETEPLVRRRFSLLHEFKHVLDFYDADLLHNRLGSGDPEVRDQQIELICNEFAAQVLMPRKLVVTIWRKTGNVALAASLFNVSAEAMATRLTKLGLIGSSPPRPRHYFRSTGSPADPFESRVGAFYETESAA